ncbi:cell adhesion molecule 2-like [Amphiura filiformis]|uniref:cell adhesion molecule 2-like n=1 Tax=Amphiura filiformis TaxID=82378 RepID=UPI003B222BE7
MLGTFVVLMISSLLTPGSLSQDSVFKNPPSDTVGVIDYNVTMYCQIENGDDIDVYWHCNIANGTQDVTIGPNENTNYAIPQYIIDNFSASLGQYNLIITDVTELDSGTCDCVIVNRNRNRSAQWSGARLEIVDSPEPPEEVSCTIDKDRTPGQPAGTFIAEDIIRLTCVSEGGVPLADIHWEIIRNGTQEGSKILSYASTTNASITIIADYNITSLDDGAYFQCIQNHIALNYTNICSPSVDKLSAPITVIYPPVLYFVPEALRVDRKLNETLQCEYRANPDLLSGPQITNHIPSGDVDVHVVNQTLDLRYVIAGQNNTVQLLLDDDDIGKMIECVATNDLGTTVITLKIEDEVMPREPTNLLPLRMILVIMVAGVIAIVLMAVVIYFIWCTDGTDVKDTATKDNVYANVPARPREGLRVRFQDSVMELVYHENDYEYEEGGSSVPGQPIKLDDINIGEFSGGKELQGCVNEGIETEENVYSDYIENGMINLDKIQMDMMVMGEPSLTPTAEESVPTPPPHPKQHFYEVPLDI